MLIWARGENPFTTTESVELRFPSKISSTKLDKWANGDELPSINEVKELAKIYRLPFACFYLTAIPDKKPKKYTDRRTYSGTVYDGISYEPWGGADCYFLRFFAMKTTLSTRKITEVTAR